MGAIPLLNPGQIQSNSQIISAYGSQASSVSLVNNLVQGIALGDTHKLTAAVTDQLKVPVYFAGFSAARLGLPLPALPGVVLGV